MQMKLFADTKMTGRRNTAIVLGLTAVGWLYLSVQVLTMDSRGSLAEAGPGMQILAFAKAYLLGDPLAFVTSLSLCATTSGQWGLTDVMKTSAMWVCMILAMMLPVLLPSLRKASAAAPSSGIFATELSGYVAAWIPFCVTGIVLQWILTQTGDLDAYHVLRNDGLSAGILVLVTLVHLAGLKRSRQERRITFCEQRGLHGQPFCDGLAFGLHSMRRCGPLMLGMFAVGLMNVVAMMVLSVLMVLETSGRHGTVSAAIGAGALLAALYALA